MNYYNLLGVGRNATQEKIKEAYRRLARRHHPDLNPNDNYAEKKFKEINEASEVLSNPNSRKIYDLYGNNWKKVVKSNKNDKNARVNTKIYTSFDFNKYKTFHNTNINNNFGSLWNEGNAKSNIASSEISMSITLLEAKLGTKRILNLNIDSKIRKFEVKIPKGVDTGSIIKIYPEQSSELLIRINILNHDKFVRKGINLYMDIFVPFEDLIIGGETEVQTLLNKISLKIPAGSKNRQKIKLLGEGMPKRISSEACGDLYVTLNPIFPDSLSSKQKDIIQTFKNS
tara:strand:+ start:729 stop:1583 length:855 start_codon:yes stop_codon:yes gene_type:complete